MPLYKITWEIEVEADTAIAAVIIAKEIQLDKNSEATYFVTENMTTKKKSAIHLKQKGKWKQ